MPQVHFLLVGGSMGRSDNGGTGSGGRQSRHLNSESILDSFEGQSGTGKL